MLKKRLRRQTTSVALLMLALLGFTVSGAIALPTLQIYIEGATYDAGSETWLTMNGQSRLWVVGSFNADESIADVRLSAAFAANEMATGSITLTRTTTNYGGVTDTYLAPMVPVLQYTGIGAIPVDLNGNGTIDYSPVMSDGSNIPIHGIFGANTNWYQWQLGDMTRYNESLIGDFANTFPTLGPHTGEIFAYDLTVRGFAHGVHFDAFNHVQPAQGRQGSIFAPYSHDGGLTAVPEPTTLLGLGAGLSMLGGMGFARRRRKH